MPFSFMDHCASILKAERDRAEAVRVFLGFEFLAADVACVGDFATLPLPGEAAGEVAHQAFLGDAVAVGEGVAVEENVMHDGAGVGRDEGVQPAIRKTAGDRAFKRCVAVTGGTYRRGAEIVRDTAAGPQLQAGVEVGEDVAEAGTVMGDGVELQARSACVPDPVLAFGDELDAGFVAELVAPAVEAGDAALVVDEVLGLPRQRGRARLFPTFSEV